jgi:Flp pilus assembly pilin Flp
MWILNAMRRVVRSESGQDAIEYALITGLFSLLVVAVFPDLMSIVAARFAGVTALLRTVAAG